MSGGAGARPADLGEALRAALRTRVYGRPLFFTETTGSTNADAHDLVRRGTPPGTLVVAARQTAGRGRLGRTFVSPPGGLYLSLVLEPPGDPATAWRCGFAAALAAREAIVAAGGPGVEFDWPNDLVLGDRKVGGLLMELVTTPKPVLILGIGLNLGPDPRASDAAAAGPAGPIPAFGGRDVRVAVAAELLARLEDHVPRCGDDAGWRGVLDGVRAVSRAARGARVAVRDVQGMLYEGRGAGLRDDGAIVIEQDDGATVVVRYGDRVYDEPGTGTP